MVSFDQKWLKNFLTGKICQVKNWEWPIFTKILWTYRKSGCDNLKNVSSLAYLTPIRFNDRADFVKSEDLLECDQSEERLSFWRFSQIVQVIAAPYFRLYLSFFSVMAFNFFLRSTTWTYFSYSLYKSLYSWGVISSFSSTNFVGI